MRGVSSASVGAQNRALLRKLLVIVAVMLGFSFAMVPFYRKICEATGISATRATANTQVDASRWVTVELIANTNRNLPWAFEPMQRSVRLHPGEIVQILYRVANLTDEPMVGQAMPSYGPANAGKYLKKLDCFCFSRQTLAPREVRQMPVVFVVTNDLPRDVDTITLSYTFFDINGV